MRMKFIGTASGIPTYNRNNCCVMLESRWRRVLLDCGEPAGATLARAGINANSIDKIFISHMHIDHLGGIFQLVQNMQITRRSAPLEVILPAEGLASVKAFFDAVYLFPEALPFKINMTPAKSGVIVDEQGFFAQVVENRHLASLRELASRSGRSNKGQSLSFRIEMDGQSVVYSGDIKSCDEMAPLLDGKRTDAVISELAHVGSRQLFDFLQGYDVGKIVITHIHPDRNDEEAMICEECPTEMRKILSVVSDGTEVDV